MSMHGHAAMMSGCRHIVFGLLILVGSVSPAHTQSGPSDLKVFGYFQPQFSHQTAYKDLVRGDTTFAAVDPATNSFVLQQLNLFLQKDLGPKLSSFVNFEAVNNFSTDQKWGSFRLEEAWVRYRHSRDLNLKFGLQIPIFNNLNEIKNRTPLIPYVIRPLVYESSFVDIIGVRVYVPQQAFAQAFGWVRLGNVKLDYAAYLGNTELVNSGFNVGPDGRNRDLTGVDTTTAVLIGGRVGVRHGELKVGLSATSDRAATLHGAEAVTGLDPSRYRNTPRKRLGADLSYHILGFSFESEWIGVALDEPPEIDIELAFYYATLGYHFTDRLQGYASYWHSKEKQRVFNTHESIAIIVPGFGLAYMLEDQITLKAQYAQVEVDFNYDVPDEDFSLSRKSHYLTVAVSVTF